MGFKVIHWNCRSIRSNGQWLRSSPFQDCQVLCLQETFLNANSTFSIPHMHNFLACRNSSRGGGLLTAVRSSLPSYRVTLPPDSSGSVEALGVRVYANGSWLTIINLYLPRGVFVDSWFDDLIRNVDPPFLLLGDFNINLLCSHPPFTPGLQRFHSWVLNQNIHICNTVSPTRTAIGAPPSLLDLTLASPTLYNSLSVSVHPDPFDSDHQPVIISLGDPWPPSGPFGLRRSSVNWTLASQHLNDLLNNCHPAAASFTSFQSVCHTAVSKCTFTPRSPTRPNEPWWDSTCRQLLGLKRKHLRLARSLCSKDHWLLYKRTASKLRRYIKQASRKYWDSVCVQTG